MILPKSITIFFQSIIYCLLFFFFKFFFKLEFIGLKNVLKLPPGIIFAPNHISEWDSLFLRRALPLTSRKFSPVYYVAKKKEFYSELGWRRIFYGGFIFKLVGAYPVNSGKKDYIYSLQDFIRFLEHKNCVCIFPEGSINKGGTVHYAHGGVAFLSHATKTPVVPVAIKEVHDNKQPFLFGRKRIVIAFGEPIHHTEIVPSDNAKYLDYKLGSSLILERIYGIIGSI